MCTNPQQAPQASESPWPPWPPWPRWRQAGLLYVAAVFASSITATIPLAVWISPILILLFIERVPRLIGFLLFMAMFVTGSAKGVTGQQKGSAKGVRLLY